ncbi:MAG: hypothetical protein IPJ98_21970 [Bryobacterales bacterium]|nr:hypothetical protein [Bryobacterales bacterium]
MWIVFVLEYSIEIALWPDRKAYARKNWLSLAGIVLSFPLVPAMLSPDAVGAAGAGCCGWCGWWG